ncbi:hypothetical protein H7827_10395 [Streptomyces sp. JH002]|uniref:NAD-dependent epimerase/dehydratase n=1 Tax=Streptomyces xiamenensis TaxID=408015 RepID=A0A0F7FXZ4_9ACTN|nr:MULTISPECIES: hypothetical protein [Streptomyces]AKG44894.1 NAD-dependent epimerase/dehydratase [Streptomyces xiamenensis]
MRGVEESGWNRAVEVTADSVRVGDAVTLGGRTLTVADLNGLPNGAKQLRFATGEILTLHCRSALTVTRLSPPPPRAYRRRREDR